jgi:hypothetical protein
MKVPVTTCPQLWPFSSYSIPQPVKEFDVVFLSYCMARRSILVLDSIFMKKKKSEHGLDIV